MSLGERSGRRRGGSWRVLRHDWTGGSSEKELRAARPYAPAKPHPQHPSSFPRRADPLAPLCAARAGCHGRSGEPGGTFFASALRSKRLQSSYHALSAASYAQTKCLRQAQATPQQNGCGRPEVPAFPGPHPPPCVRFDPLWERRPLETSRAPPYPPATPDTGPAAARRGHGPGGDQGRRANQHTLLL